MSQNPPFTPTLQYNNCTAIQPSDKIGKGTVKIHACFKNC